MHEKMLLPFGKSTLLQLGSDPTQPCSGWHGVGVGFQIAFWGRSAPTLREWGIVG